MYYAFVRNTAGAPSLFAARGGVSASTASVEAGRLHVDSRIVITAAHSSDESGAYEDDDAGVDDDARFVAEYGLIPRMAVVSTYTIAALNAELC